MSDEQKVKRGFAAMSPEKQREISSRGGKTAHARGVAHKFDSESAKRAASIAYAGGKLRHWTPEEAREAGRKAREARIRNAAQRTNEVAS